MNDPFEPRPEDGLRDLVPWADPYIAALIEKLRRSVESDRQGNYLIDELPPSPDSRDTDGDDPRGQWTPRNWPTE